MDLTMPPLIIDPKRHEDERGWFCEVWNSQSLARAGLHLEFCQDNQSFSALKGTLRGLHFQVPPYSQAKLVRCDRGRIFDVAVDVRRASPTFGQWLGVELSAEDGRQLLIPTGYAHGFLTLEDDCLVSYKVDALYSASHDRGLAWDDPDVGIKWPISSEPIMSGRDKALPALADLEIELEFDGAPLARPVEVRP